MLEIFLLFFFCRKCARMAREKGHSGGLYGFLAVALWVVLEIFSMVFAILFVSDELLVSYLFALLGAGAGALFAWLIVKNLPERQALREPVGWAQPPAPPRPADDGPVWCVKCGTRLQPGAQYCDKCGTPAAKL